MPDGVVRKFTEATALRYTPENRDRMMRQAEMIGAEIRGGAFDYLKWFPSANRAAEYLVANGAPPQQAKVAPSGGWTVRRYYSEWIERKIAPFVRVSAARDYRNHFRGYILDVLGNVTLEDLTLAHLEDLRTTMRKRGLSEKTIRNVIDGSFRAMARDAGQDDVPAAFPFPKVRWPEKIVPGPSPFTAEERDQILDYFEAKRWKVGGFNDTRLHYPYFVFLFTLFFTGMRPSEAVAVRIRCLNLGARTVQVERSRHLGAEAAPKTPRPPGRTPDMEKCRGSGAADRTQGPAGGLSVQERPGRADRGGEFLRPVPRRAAGAIDLPAARSILGQGHVYLTGADQRRESGVAVGADRRGGDDHPEALWPVHPFFADGRFRDVQDRGWKRRGCGTVWTPRWTPSGTGKPKAT